MSTSSMATPSFLMIGATGRMGLELIRAAAHHPSHPPIHAFCRTPAKMPEADVPQCASIQKGDACNASDVEQALEKTGASVVLISVGVPNSTAPSDVRQRSAQAVFDVLQKLQYSHVRVVLISAVGAGGSVIDYGWGIGWIVTFVLKHLLKDHDRQEEILGQLGQRLMIVRPMGLGDGEGSGVAQFEGRAPCLTVSRKDLAEWTLAQVYLEEKFGEAVNVTGKAA